jgi:energy-coupling factor transporter ATP-binding protein EcfA2
MTIRKSIFRGAPLNLNLPLSILVCLLSFGSVLSFSAENLISWAPSSVSLQDVSQSYPSSVWRRLTSSVPRREFALENLSLSIESEFIMLVGASSSGKSTILRVLLGEEPVSGTVHITTTNSNPDDVVVSPALPVLLAERPPFESQQSVRSLWTTAILQQTQTPAPMNDSDSAPFVELLLDDMTTIFELRDLEKKPCELSSSENFRCRLAEASLQSMLHHYHHHHGGGVSSLTSSSSPNPKQPPQLLLPAPILLLDEWMDKETSTVIRKVQTSLERLVNRGAVIVCVTHKPHLYSHTTTDKNNDVRLVTLCRGAILPNNLVL